MKISQQERDQAFSKYRSSYGGLKEDYFPLLYISKEYKISIEDAKQYTAFGGDGSDYGIDAFYVDTERRNLYLYQFKWSEDHKLFRDSLHRLIDAGFDRIFGKPVQDQKQNQLLLQLKACLGENRSIIERVIVNFVYNGDPDAAENSVVLQNLIEDLFSKKYIVDEYFKNQEIVLTSKFISNKSRNIAGLAQEHKTHTYEIDFNKQISGMGPQGECLYVGYITLYDLRRMHMEMGQRFFERNIRFGLSSEKAPNREIRKALARIIVKEEDSPNVFMFNHNGITMAVENIEWNEDRKKLILTEPRLLNGAQTVTSLARFIDENKDNPAYEKNKDILRSIKVLAKIIDNANNEFIINVTICNNRQNRVEPWNLRANDNVQLELQDKFREELKVFYSRQEKAFENLTDDDLEDLGLDPEIGKAIEIKYLAQTFLAAQGEVDKMSRMPEVFENKNIYENTFRRSYLNSDARAMLLAYKIRFRIGRIVNEIIYKGENKYRYMNRARNLVWALLIQGFLNDSEVEWLKEQYGHDFYLRADFGDYFKRLASTKVRPILAVATKDKRIRELMDSEKYSFLSTKAMYDRCVNIAWRRYRWSKKSI